MISNESLMNDTLDMEYIKKEYRYGVKQIKEKLGYKPKILKWGIGYPKNLDYLILRIFFVNNQVTDIFTIAI